MSSLAVKTFRTLCSNKVVAGSKPIVMVTAYDSPTMRFATGGGANIVLVGDSAAMVMLGYESTMKMTHSEMKMLVSAVARTNGDMPIVADMVWGSYHISVEKAVENAVELIQCGAHAVKVEGGVERVSTVKALVDAKIPVVGHVGLTPQSILEMGSYKVQGKDLEKAQKVLTDAKAVQEAGAVMLVVECVPDALSRTITEELEIPVIGIGAGRHVDGQVLVVHDLLGIGQDKPAKFVRQYSEFEKLGQEAVKSFVEDVLSGNFPNSNETYHMADDVLEEMQKSNALVEVDETENTTL
jgi:3-methyl-2-oxobutanoate hydroxymethyltransferase